MHTLLDEEWETIRDFSMYKISNLGRVFNLQTEKVMRTSKTLHGHVKITLVCDQDGQRYTRGVALLVAQAFVEPPTLLCDAIILLDGNLSNTAAYNIAWRPSWFAWKYSHQLKTPQPIHFHNLAVYNLTRNVEYRSIIEAGMAEGLLFQHIWESTYTGKRVFPYGQLFEVSERV